MSIRRITVSEPVSITDFMNVGYEAFALDVVHAGVTVNFQGVAVSGGNPCELRGSLMSVVVDPGVPSETIPSVFHQLHVGAHSIIEPGTKPDLCYPVRWSGGELPGSKTFAMRDFTRRVISAIETATSIPVAA